MARNDRGDLKKALYDMFTEKIETDIIDMVFAGCNYSFEEATTALSNMCQSPVKKAKEIEQNTEQFTVVGGTHNEYKRKPTTPKRKTMFLLRGLPGSGKTRLANDLKQDGDVVLSTDDYFKNGSRFNFRGDQLQDAHDWNLARARAAMRREDINNIFIDNTNTRCWEMMPYVEAAQQHGYNIDILIPKTPWAWDVDELERRNDHGVPKRTLLKMFERFEKDITVERMIKDLQPKKPEKSINDEYVLMGPVAFETQQEDVDMRPMTGSKMEHVTTALKKPLQEIYDKEVSKRDIFCMRRSNDVSYLDIHGERNSAENQEDFFKNDRPVEESVRPESPPVMSNMEEKEKIYDEIIDDDFDEEFAAAMTVIGSRTKLDVKPKVNAKDKIIDKEDLKFLSECFPNFSIDVLESVYLQFNGNMQRICNEIMEQPSVKTFYKFEMDSDAEDRVTKLDRIDNDSCGEIVAKKDRKSKTSFMEVSAVKDFDAKTKFVMRLDRSFFHALREHVADDFPDDISDEDTELPIDDFIAEEIYSRWKIYYKTRRKEVFDKSKTAKGKQGKQTKREDSQMMPGRQKLKSSSSANEQFQQNQHQNQGKMQGSFRPWSAIVSGPPKDIRFPEPNRPIWSPQHGENLETRLYTMFPTVKKDVLDEILIAMNYNIDAAMETVRTSLMLTPKPNGNGSDEVSDMLEGKQNKSFAINSREKESGAKMSEKSAKSKSRATLKAAGKQTDDKSIVLIDLTSSTHPSFQALSGNSYADYRAEAQAHAAVRKEWLRKAAKAYTENQGHVASYCAEQARKQAILMKEANERAASLIFLNKNSDRDDPASFDFHGLHCEEAVEMLEEILKQAENHHLKYVDVVTGRGTHSKGKVAKLRSSVLNYLNGQQIRYTKLNDGCFRVHLKG